MCKLFAITNTQFLTRKQLDQILRRLNLRFQETEEDGFGWALAPRRSRPPHPPHIVERFVSPATFGGLDGGIRIYDSLDEQSDAALDIPDADYSTALPADFEPSGPLIVHGRSATGHVSLVNTHPFQKNGWTMAHNGVVEEVRPGYYDTETECDSEHLLNCFALGEGPREFAVRVRGKYAVAAISPENRLHICKNYLASLWAARCDELGWVFATDPRDLFSIFQLLKLRRPVPVPVSNNTHIILAADGSISSTELVNPVQAIPIRPVITYANQAAAGWRHQGSPNPGAY